MSPAFPRRFPGPGLKQSIGISLPDPPDAGATLCIWLRGDKQGRAATIKAPDLPPPPPAPVAPATAPPPPTDAPPLSRRDPISLSRRAAGRFPIQSAASFSRLIADTGTW